MKEQSYNIVKQHSNTQDEQKKKRSVADFIFCHEDGFLKSLIMLANHQHILHKILQDALEPQYFWIFSNCQLVEHILQFVAKQVRDHSHVFNSLEDMNAYLIQQTEAKVIIISSHQYEDYLHMVLRRQQIIGVILYCNPAEVDSNDNYKANSQQDEEGHNNKGSLKQRIKKCSTIEQLNCLLNLNLWSLTQTKQFSNFVLLKQQVQQSTMLSRTMVAMLKESITIEVRSQIINQLTKLVQKLCKYHPKLKFAYENISEALKQLTKISIPAWQIINMYTSEKYKFYIILNSFLRAMSCPTELYYVQPLFIELFKAIKKLNELFPQKQFVCYRGGFTSAEEFQRLYCSVGDVVQNLGFLSTSSKKSTAEAFKKNVLYQLRVNNRKSNDNIQPGLDTSPGFAFISNFSQYWDEQQILFNPLNYFDILEVTIKTSQQISQFQYVLQYRYTSTHSEHQFQSKECIDTLLLCHQQMKQQVKKQTHVLFTVQNLNQFETAQIYYQFYHDKAKRLSTKINTIFGNQISKTQLQSNKQEKQSDSQRLEMYLPVAFQMASALFVFGKYNQALALYERIQKSHKDLSCFSSIQHVKILTNTGNILCNLGKQKEALPYYRECLEIQDDCLRQQESNYLAILNNIGAALQKMNKLEEALQLYKKCQIATKGLSGMKKINYLSYLNNIGNTLQSLGKYQEALRTYQQCQRGRKQILGERHPHYLSSLNNIGSALKNLARYEEALQAFKKCEKIRRDVLGSKHPDYLCSVNNVGVVLQYLGKYEEALSIHEQCKNARRDILGETHRLYLISVNNVKKNLICLGRQCEAFSLLKQLRNKGVLKIRSYQSTILGTSLAALGLFLGEFQQAFMIILSYSPQIVYNQFSFSSKILFRMHQYVQCGILLRLLIRHIEQQLKKVRLSDRTKKLKQLEGYQLTKEMVKNKKKQQGTEIQQAKNILDFL